MSEKIDEKKLNIIMLEVIKKEKENLATKQYTSGGMKNEIKKILVKHVNSRGE